MLLDLRVVLAAILATVLLLTAGFSLIAGVRSPLKPSLGFTISGPPEARALNVPPQASAQPRQLPVLNRTPEIIAPAITAETPPREKKNISVAIHEQATFTEEDKAAKSTLKGPEPKQVAKAKKKARPAAAPPPAKPAFSFGQ